MNFLGVRAMSVTSQMDELHERLSAIEHTIDAGTYRPGPWAAWLRVARAAPAPVRRALADDVSRVSTKLHREHFPRRCPLGLALALEVAATIAAGGLLWLGRALGSDLVAILALVIAISTVEPLCKLSVGAALGIGYQDAYLRGIEPRFKMRYGTYLAAPRPARIVLGLAGCVGSPLAALVVGRLARPRLPTTATLATVLFWAIVAANVGFFLLALLGARRIGTFPLTMSSGGSAGEELHAALTSRP